MSTEKPKRKQLRLTSWDYTKEGHYFVTMSTIDRSNVLGEVVNDRFNENECGRIIREVIEDTSCIRPGVQIDVFVVMPNHVHMIVEISNRATRRVASTSALKPDSLGSIVGQIKSVASKRINLKRNSPAQAFWQRNYYEHVIRNEEDYVRICNYILNNPLEWPMDDENPQAVIEGGKSNANC